MGLDFLDMMAKARSSKGGGPYFQPGKGVVWVKGFRCGLSSRKKEMIFVADYYFESSTSYPYVENLEPGQPAKANAPGTSCTYVQNLTKNADMAPGKMRDAIFSAVTDVEFDPENVADEMARQIGEHALSAANPARGVRVGYETRQVKTKAGKWITVPDFIRLPGQPDEEIAKRRALLDTGEQYSNTAPIEET